MMHNEPHGQLNVALDLEALEKEIDQNQRSRMEGEYSNLSGTIAGAAPARPTKYSSDPIDASVDFDTLDEPVMVTIKRDAKLIGQKCIQVLFPAKNQDCLRDWDLWGPLFVCVFLSLLLQGSDTANGPKFTESFTLVFFGACVVTANIKLLGGKISFFQSLCVIGYCLLPSAFASVACHVINLQSAAPKLGIALRLLSCGLGFAWSTYASTAFLAAAQPERRKFLAVYPMFLFYFVVGWLVFSNS